MSKIRVVLIEDHELTRMGIRTTLQQSEEIEIVGEAANGSEGIRVLQSLHPDVAIVDIGLPDKDGIEVTREIKLNAGSDSNGTKVLILTLRDNREAVLAAFAAGADSYCMKDNQEALLGAIKITSQGNSWIDPAIAKIVLRQAQDNQTASLSSHSPTQTIASRERTGIGDRHHGNDEETIDPYTLTERELEVLQLIVEGCSNAIIAERLYITVGTVKTHVRNILNKLCADDRTQAAVRALRSGLVG